MKIKKDEGLTFDIKNEGTSDIKLDNQKYYTDIYEPGQTKGRLKIGREVEGNISSSAKIKTLNFTHNLSDGVGVATFAGFGFKPKWFKIEAAADQGTTPYTTSSCTHNEDGDDMGWGLGEGETKFFTNKVVGLYKDTGSTFGDFSAFTSDGISLNMSPVNFDANLIITAYS